MSDTIQILHIEDDDGDALLIAEALETAPLRSYELRRHDGLLSAINHNDIHAADVILLDQYLPDSSGLNDSVSAIKCVTETPILVM